MLADTPAAFAPRYAAHDHVVLQFELGLATFGNTHVRHVHGLLAGIAFAPPQVQGKAEALGWIFVSEGSKLGAAFLIKRAVALDLSETFGARHLGEPAGGRAEGWKSFVKTLDGLELSAEEETDLDKGAVAAFERFTVLLEHAYAAEPELA